MDTALLFRLLEMKNRFQNNHPKMYAFAEMLLRNPPQQDTVIEINITRPGEKTISANMKVLPDDVQLLQDLAALLKARGQ